MAFGDLRRGHPRRPGARGVQALDVPRACRSGRRGHLPVHDLLRRRGLPGRARDPADPRLPQLHGAGVLRRLGAGKRGAGDGRRRRAGVARPAGAPRAGQEPVQRAGAAAGRLPAHHGRPRAGGLRARDRHARRPGRGGAGPAPAGRGRRLSLRRTDRAVQGPARARQGAVGLPPALRRRRPACTWSAARRATSTPRPCRTSCTTWDCPPPCACPGRCPTPRWRPTSRPPTPTSRCPPTRGSASRSWRPWWRACPSSRAPAGAVSDTVADAALVLADADPSYIAAALHRVCTDERAARHADGGGDAPGRGALRGPRPPASSMPSPRWWGDREQEGGLRHPPLRAAHHGWGRDRGAPAGRAPLRPDGLGGRGAHDLCARRHHLGRRARAGDDRDQRRHRAPAPVGPRPPARLLRPRRDGPSGPPSGARGSRGSGGSTTTVPSPPSWSTRSSRRTPTWSPSRPTSTTRRWRPSARCGCRRSSTRPHTTSRPCTSPCSAAPSGTPTPSASTRRPSARSSSGCTRWRSGRRSCSASASASPRGPDGPAARSAGSATAPTSSAWGVSTSTRAPKCWPRTSPPTRSGIPVRWPSSLVGPVSYELAPHPDIVVTGAVSEADKWDIVRDALVSVSPSALESFSLVVIEAWVEQLPVLVNGACGPTREHCERSGGGLWFTSYPEFEAVLRAARVRPGAAGRAGEAGAGLRRPALPLARAGQALRRVPDARWCERGRGTPGLF